MNALVLQLFISSPDEAARAVAAGIDRVVVDLERRGKPARQHGYHLETTTSTLADLATIGKLVPRERLMARINPVHQGSGDEIGAALDAGAGWLILPMFRAPEETKTILNLVAGRAPVQLLFETREAVAQLDKHLPQPFAEAYLGLNDLGIECGYRFCYQALMGGELDRVAPLLKGRPWGFGGITVVDGGAPLPTRMILHELARLGATRVILRRAFKRDADPKEWKKEVRRLREFYAAAKTRSSHAVEHDRKAVSHMIGMIVGKMR